MGKDKDVITHLISLFLCVRQQIAGLLASLVVLLVVVAIGFVFEPLPQVGMSVKPYSATPTLCGCLSRLRG